MTAPNSPQGKPIRLLIADDHHVVRKGLIALLSSPRFNLEIVGEAADGDTAVMQSLALQPDVILMDLEMPKLTGEKAIAQICAEQSDVSILVLTSFAETTRAVEAMQAGARGFLLKESSPDELVQAIYAVHRGQVSIPADIATKLWQKQTPNKPKKPPLTTREFAVLRYLVEGLPNRQIGAKLNISPHTVRSHVRNILEKLQVKNRTQAALYALEEGLLDDS